jgi:hypothetical protein
MISQTLHLTMPGNARRQRRLVMPEAPTNEDCNANSRMWSMRQLHLHFLHKHRYRGACCEVHT